MYGVVKKFSITTTGRVSILGTHLDGLLVERSRQ